MQRLRSFRSSRSRFLLCAFLLLVDALWAQNSPSRDKHSSTLIPLHESSRKVIGSETGGAFMSGSKCDAEGNLYIRKLASDRPMLGPVVKIDSDGKRIALFDPAAFTDPKLNRADAFSPAPDGGQYQIAATGGLKPQIYVIRFAPDGTPASSSRVDAQLEPYQFAAFPAGNLLVSGVQRDPLKRDDPGKNFTSVFSDDGRLLAHLSFEESSKVLNSAGGTDESKPTMDISEAEAAPDGNIYALRRTFPALVYVISPAGKLVRTLKVYAPSRGTAPTGFHVSGNRVAVSFWDDDKKIQAIVVADSQTGRTIATYSDAANLGPAFACYSADEGVFTFLQLGEQNTFEVVRADAK